MNIFLYISILILFPIACQAKVLVPAYTGGYPVSVCQPNDASAGCSSSSSPSGWLLGAGNIGISTTNNVGIGSAFPGQTLDVKGTVRVKGFIDTTNPSSGYVLTSNGAGVGTWAPASGGGSGTVSPGTLNQEGVYVGSTTVGSGIITDNGSNVGVGITSPNANFDVEGPAGTQDVFRAGLAGYSYSMMAVYSPTGDFGQGGCGETMEMDVPDINHYFQTTSCGNMTILSTDPFYIEQPGGNVYVGDGLDYSNGTYLDVNDGSQDWEFWANGSEVTSISTSGNVTAPSFITSGGSSSQFVKGDGSLDSSSYGTGTVTSVSSGAGLSGGTISTSGSLSLDLTHANTWTGQQIFNTANVGIGSTAPGSQLDVQGTLHGIRLFGNVGIGTAIINTGAALSVNGNVGIGTWVPNFLLQVGNSSTSNYFFVNSSGGATASQFSTAGGGYFKANILNLGNSVQINNSTTNNLTLNASNNFSIPSGNMGIGTTIPGAALDVEGTIYPVVFYGHGTDYNVGIGSASPGQALDVQGTVRDIGEIVGAGGINLGGTTMTTWPSGSGSNYWNVGAGNIGINTTTNNVGIGTISSSQNLSIGNGSGTMQLGGTPAQTSGGFIGYNTSGSTIFTIANEYVGNVASEIDFGFSNTPGSDSGSVLSLKQNGVVTDPGTLAVTGNVGIGPTANDGEMLSLYGPLGLEYIKSTTGTNSVGITLINTGGNYRIAADNSSGTAFVTGASAYDIDLGTDGAQGMNLYTNGVIREKILSGGNIGINSTSPGSQLDVQGTLNGVRMYGNSTNATPLQIQSSAQSNNYPLFSFSFSGDTYALGQMDSYGRMYLNAGQDSTLTPSSLDATLAISARVNSVPALVTRGLSGQSSSLISVQNSGRTEIANINSSGGAYFSGNVGIGTATQTGAFVVTGGNVGIGTWIPSAALNVKGGGIVVNGGGVNLDNNQVVSLNNTGSSGSGQIYMDTGNNFQIRDNIAFTNMVHQVNGGSFQFQTLGNSNALSIGNNGIAVFGANVGIGATPSQALDVTGTVRALTSGSCSYLYKCVGGVDAGVIQTSACNLCPAGSCAQMNLCG